jgi:hypothetical protein
MVMGGGDLDNAVQINGATDGTLIGNDLDRLRVSSYIQSGGLATYSASNVFVLPASATDVLTISGSATKTVKIFSILFYLTATTGSNATIIGLRRSSLNTGGTSTLLTNVPNDTNNAAGTAVVRSYTANPTLGTLVGNNFTYGIYVSGGGTIGSIPFSYFIDNALEQPIVLRGINQLFAVNMNAVTFAGNSARATIVWTEE